MKQHIFTLLAFLVGLTQVAQAQAPPNIINYQAVVRNTNGTPIQVVGDINVIASYSYVASSCALNDNNILFQEYFTSANANIMTYDASTGLINMKLGAGVANGGLQKPFLNNDLAGKINWEGGSVWLTIHLANGGSGSYECLTSTRLVTVPYSFYASKSDTANVARNAKTYTGGAGITVATDNTISINPLTLPPIGSLTSPNQTINVGGTFPSYTVDVAQLVYNNNSGTLSIGKDSVQLPQVVTYTAGTGINIDPGNKITSTVDVKPSGQSDNRTTVASSGTNPTFTIYTPAQTLSHATTTTGDSIRISGVSGPSAGVFIPKNIPNGTANNQTLHWNQSSNKWIATSNLLNDGTKISMGYSTLPPSLRTLNVNGGIKTDTLEVTNRIFSPAGSIYKFNSGIMRTDSAYVKNLVLKSDSISVPHIISNSGRVLTNDGNGNATWKTPTDSGLTSVGVTMSNTNIFGATVNSPLTSNGTMTISMVNQGASKFLTTPLSTVTTAQPVFRGLDATDIPYLPASKIDSSIVRTQKDFYSGFFPIWDSNNTSNDIPKLKTTGFYANKTGVATYKFALGYDPSITAPSLNEDLTLRTPNFITSFRMLNSSNLAGGLYFTAGDNVTNTLDASIINIGTGTLSIGTSNSKTMYFKGTNVGIGTTSPSALLDIQTAAATEGLRVKTTGSGVGAGYFETSNASATAPTLVIKNNAPNATALNIDGGVQVKVTANPLITNNDYMVVLPTGTTSITLPTSPINGETHIVRNINSTGDIAVNTTKPVFLFSQAASVTSPVIPSIGSLTTTNASTKGVLRITFDGFSGNWIEW